MDPQKRNTHVIIHGFAFAHAVAAATLSQTMMGDEATLTALTITMIIAIARQYGQPVEVGTAFAFLGTFAGFYLGTRGAIFCIKWIPFVGNAANAIATAVTTETLGWATYYLVSNGKRIENVNKEDVKNILEETKQHKDELKREWKAINKIIKSMDKEEKSLYNSLIDKMKTGTISEKEQKEVEMQLNELFQKYEHKYSINENK